jgi:N-acetylmuramoyl-L-alanine amidase
MRRRPALLLGVAAIFAVCALAGWLYGTLSGGGGDSSESSETIVTAKPVTKPAAEPHSSASPLRTAHGLPPAPKRAASTLTRPLTGALISVDPGHNGGNATHPEEIARPVVAYADGQTKPCNTTGTETDDGSLTEAEFNFEVATLLAARLRALGARVVMTRHDNEGVGPCVNERAEIANRAHADVAVSIHADGNLTPGARGFDVIHPATDQMVDPAMAAPSRALAEDLRNALLAAGAPTANYVGHQGLDARDDLGGLNLSRIPVSMVELGNMRSAQEAGRLESPAYRARLAEGIAAGVAAFLARRPGTGD